MSEKKKQELNQKILEVAQEIGFTGNDWIGLADELIKRKIKTLSGLSFTPNNLQHYCQRQKLQFQIDLEVLKESQKLETDDSPLTPEEIVAVRRMVEWWESKRMGLDGVERRPVFKGESKNTGIKINQELLERSLRKAKAEKLKTGGNLSGLIEFLLWKYLGEPDDFLES